MAKDPAFLFYTKDFLTGIADLTMEERGQYITLLCQQHQKGHLSDKLISLCVGNAAADVMAKFRQDSAGLWYNERLDQEIEKRQAHGAKQRERAVEGWKKRKKDTESMPNESPGNAAALPLVNANGNVNGNVIEDKKGVQGETDFSDYERWTDDAISGNDHLFTNMLRGLKTHPRDQLPDLARSHLALLAKYPKMKPSDQNRFRISLIDHIAKELKNGNQNRNTKSHLSSASVITTGKDFGDF